MRDIFEAAFLLAKEQGIEKNAQAREQKFNRLEFLYAKYVALKSKSGTNGESTLCKPPQFEEMYKLERHNARHDPPAVIELGIEGVEGSKNQGVNSSTMKRAHTA